VKTTSALMALIPFLLLAGCASTPTQPLELSGSAWTVTGYRADGQLQPLLPGSRLNARFGDDGRVTGSAGCNMYFASYQGSAAELRISPAGATRKACPEPAGIMQQETRFLDALGASTSAVMRDGQLQLLQADGSVTLTLSRAAD